MPAGASATSDGAAMDAQFEEFVDTDEEEEEEEAQPADFVRLAVPHDKPRVDPGKEVFRVSMPSARVSVPFDKPPRRHPRPGWFARGRPRAPARRTVRSAESSTESCSDEGLEGSASDILSTTDDDYN